MCAIVRATATSLKKRGRGRGILVRNTRVADYRSERWKVYKFVAFEKECDRSLTLKAGDDSFHSCSNGTTKQLLYFHN